jgi:hypothetical protein
MKWFAGLGIFGILLWLCLVVVIGAAWIHGIYLAFSASVVLGIVCIFIEIPFPVFAIVYWLTGNDLAQQIVEYFSR